ncbi:hypothetical protein KFL_000500070 [Klebsormidium nitens]|uniref:RRM domain-containing protein n=1 Tax=Klebsormidium nitens TaxID=105231 RepID=A0A1Y1HNN2_KLENI|nr:hypothetical protein KFL_000500070 [Klebsormidium nitens]|eukprot:GAQ80255.1 hypothetical protein KFL_000500070 [Klebsormidium nitens]
MGRTSNLQEEMDVPGQPDKSADVEANKLQKKMKRKLKKEQRGQEASEQAEERLDTRAVGADQSKDSSEGPEGPSPSGGGEASAFEDAGDENEDEKDEQAEGVRQGEKRVRRAGSKKLSKEKLEKLKEKYRKRGVVYVSRIPPHLKPLKLRHMLEPFGEVLRIYLAPEDTAIRARRKRAGGDSGKNFTEGWVEFAKKGVAKRVAEMLNGQPMGGPKRSAYHYDLWNLKYLHKFKWDNLTEEIAYRNAVREQRLAAEISSAKRERDFYLAKVDQSRAFSAMDERRKKRKIEATTSTPGEDTAAAATSEGAVKVRRRFPQRSAVAALEEEPRPLLSSSILSKVFSGNS